MDKGITQFQSLSRAEAIQMCEHVAKAILHAYEAGFNVAANNYDSPLDDLFIAHRDALDSLGFGHIAIGGALSVLIPSDRSS